MILVDQECIQLVVLGRDGIEAFVRNAKKLKIKIGNAESNRQIRLCLAMTQSCGYVNFYATKLCFRKDN